LQRLSPRLVAAVALTGLALLLGSCGKSQAVRLPCPAGQLCFDFGNDSEPISLDPHKMTGTWESRIADDLLVGLTQNDASGRPIPGMAKSWETSADGKVWTFHLRDANWSDGVPMTADDFVFSLRRIMDPATGSQYSSLLYIIQNAEAVNAGKAPLTALGVRAIDPHTLQITLTHPAPYLPELAKHETMLPVPKHVVEKWGDGWSRPEHYVGNGPYKLVSWRIGDHINLVRNPLYWDNDKVCFDQINYFPTADSISAERQVRRGELDADDHIEPNRVAFLRQPDEAPEYVRVHTYLGINYLTFNTKDVPAFRDVRVRRALSMAIDRDFIANKLDRGVYQPAYTFIPPGVASYTAPAPPIWAAWPLARRQAAARALLAQAGYGPSHPLSVELKHSNATSQLEVMPSIQSDWQTIGVKTTLIQEETQISYQDDRLRNFQATSAAWIADYNDAMSFLYLQQSATGSQNYGDYNNPAYDALLAKADNEPDPVRRAVYMQQAEEIVLRDAPVAPYTFRVNTNLVSPRISGWVDNIVDIHPSQYLCVKGQRGH
jgi:oligopeptide transport system substrate-binding protein